MKAGKIAIKIAPFVKLLFVFIVWTSLITYFNIFALTYPFKEFFIWEPLFWAEKNIGYYIFANVIVFVFCMLVFLVSNAAWALGVSFGTTFVLGAVNHYMKLYRDEYFVVQHLSIAKEAGGLCLDFNKKELCCFILVFAVGITLVIFFSFIFRNYKIKNKKSRLIFSVVLFVLTTVILGTVSISQYEDKIFGRIKQDEQGPMVVFVESLYEGIASQLYMNGLEEILKEVESKYPSDEFDASRRRPNIIVIMSEAFWDMSDMIDYIDMKANPYEEFDAIKKESVSGNVAVNIYGGNTVTSEFEFLTGLNSKRLQYLPSYYYKNADFANNTFVSYLKELGYYEVAIHPYIGSFWSRDVGYAQMGFDKFVDRSHFNYFENYNEFMSDDSFIKQIIYEYENNKKTGKPQFIFGVSIMNHTVGLVYEMSGTDTYKDILEINMSSEVDDKTKESATVYLNGIKITCESLKELTDYLKQQDEETILVFFGDHAPHFAKDLYEQLGKNRNDFYRTPYIIWSNKEGSLADNDEQRDFNLSYLSSVLVDYLDFEKTKQVKLNLMLKEIRPVDTNFETEKDNDYENIDEKEFKYFKWCIEDNNADNWKIY